MTICDPRYPPCGCPGCNNRVRPGGLRPGARAQGGCPSFVPTTLRTWCTENRSLLENLAAIAAFLPQPPALPFTETLFQPFIVIASGCNVGESFRSECRIAATKCRIGAAICAVMGVAGAFVTIGVSVVVLGAFGALLAGSATILDNLADGHSPDSDAIAAVITASGGLAGVDLKWLADFVKSPIGRQAVAEASESIGLASQRDPTERKKVEDDIFVAGATAFLSGVLDLRMSPDQVLAQSQALVDQMRRQAGLSTYTKTKFFQAVQHWKLQGAKRTPQAAVEAISYRFAAREWFPGWSAAALTRTAPGGPGFNLPHFPGTPAPRLPTPTSGGQSGSGGGGGLLLAAAAAAALALATG